MTIMTQTEKNAIATAIRSRNIAEARESSRRIESEFRRSWMQEAQQDISYNGLQRRDGSMLRVTTKRDKAEKATLPALSVLARHPSRTTAKHEERLVLMCELASANMDVFSGRPISADDAPAKRGRPSKNTSVDVIEHVANEADVKLVLDMMAYTNKNASIKA